MKTICDTCVWKEQCDPLTNNECEYYEAIEDNEVSGQYNDEYVEWLIEKRRTTYKKGEMKDRDDYSDGGMRD